MKKFISIIAITALFFSCSKTDITPTEASEIAGSYKAKGGNGNGGGGNGGGGGQSVTTDEATYILPFGATSGGEVPSSGGGNNVTERGVCYSTSPNPTIDDETVVSGSGSGIFTSILPGLDGGTIYYARAYANKNKKGIIIPTYGNEVSFTTPEPIYGTVTDIDGNTYTTIEIGTQVWMMENLKTTTYRDGTIIPNVTDEVEWTGLSSGAYCNYGNYEANVATYGRLYNWYAIDDAHNIAPEGWHVPTEDEYKILMNYIGGPNVTGIKLKEAGNVHWVNQPWYGNVGGDNSSGFTALPGGCRNMWGGSGSSFNYKNDRGNWWTASELGADNAQYMYLQSSSAWIWGIWYNTGMNDRDKRSGHSVRCVKD